LPPDRADLVLELELGEALLWVGRLGDAVRRADALTEGAAARGDAVAELCGRIKAGRLRLAVGEVAAEDLGAIVGQAPPPVHASGDGIALSIAYEGRSEVAGRHGRNATALEAYELGLSHARKAGYQPAGTFASRSSLRFFGTTAASDLLVWLDENEPQAGRDY